MEDEAKDGLGSTSTPTSRMILRGSSSVQHQRKVPSILKSMVNKSTMTVDDDGAGFYYHTTERDSSVSLAACCCSKLFWLLLLLLLPLLLLAALGLHEQQWGRGEDRLSEYRFYVEPNRDAFDMVSRPLDMVRYTMLDWALPNLKALLWHKPIDAVRYVLIDAVPSALIWFKGRSESTGGAYFGSDGDQLPDFKPATSGRQKTHSKQRSQQ